MDLENCSLRCFARSDDKDTRAKRPRETQDITWPPSLLDIHRKRQKKTVTITLLPDGPIGMIFSYLRANDSSGTFQAPRDAFALAQTNKRFLRLFGMQITRIAADITNLLAPTLSPAHMLSAARLAGPNLREIHVVGCSDTLPVLSKVCPNLEILSIVDDPSCSKEGLSTLLQLSLSSLAVTRPTPECILLLVPPPQELSLYEVQYPCYSALAAVLHQPPRRFNLTFDRDFGDMLNCSSFIRLRKSLFDAIPKIESVYVKICSAIEECSSHMWPHTFQKEAERLIAAARKNDEGSVCKSIRVEGKLSFPLLKKVHPAASISVSRWDQKFADSGDGIYAKRIPLSRFYTSMDFSRLEEVHIEMVALAYWKQKLSNVRLKRALVEDRCVAERLELSVETVEIPLQSITGCGSSWHWLKGVRQVRILGLDEETSSLCQIQFLTTLGELLDNFNGESVWIEAMKPHFFITETIDHLLRVTIRTFRKRVLRFEARGGEAGTLKAMADIVLKRCSTGQL